MAHNKRYIMVADSIHRIIANNGRFFGVACNTTNLVNTACRRHDVGPTAGAALGRALTGAVLLSALLKDGQSVMLKFEGSGPLKKILAEAGYDGWSRGYVAEPKVDLPLKDGIIDVAGGVGKAGFLTVTKDIGMKERYQGTVQLFTSEIGGDIAYYLTESEQTPSTIGLGVHFEIDGTVAAAGGFLIQSLPPADEELIIQLEKKISTLPPITTQLLENRSPTDILSNIFGSIPHKPTGSTQLKYQCSCNREKMLGALLTLGEDESRKMLAQEGGIQINCEFCRDNYLFEKTEIEKLFQTPPNIS